MHSLKPNISNNADSISDLRIGGIGGWLVGNVWKCKSNVNITLSDISATNIYVGGICGTFGTGMLKGVLVGCANTGNISFTEAQATPSVVYVAGVSGYRTGTNAMIESSYNTGAVTLDFSGCTASNCTVHYGGITNSASVQKLRINNCFNLGNIIGSFPESNEYTLCGGAVIGSFAGTAYPTNCAYLKGTFAGTAMCDNTGKEIDDETSLVKPKSAEEIKHQDFLDALNGASPITDYAVTWIFGTDS